MPLIHINARQNLFARRARARARLYSKGLEKRVLINAGVMTRASREIIHEDTEARARAVAYIFIPLDVIIKRAYNERYNAHSFLLLDATFSRFIIRGNKF